MAKKETPAPIEDPAGEEYMAAFDEAWVEAERLAEESGRHPLDHYQGYVERQGKKEVKVPGLAPALPDFGAAATDAVKVEVLGRFVIQEGQVHDTTRAVRACNLGPLGKGQSRNFIHFAQEIPEEAARHDACMG